MLQLGYQRSISEFLKRWYAVDACHTIQCYIYPSSPLALRPVTLSATSRLSTFHLYKHTFFFGSFPPVSRVTTYAILRSDTACTCVPGVYISNLTIYYYPPLIAVLSCTALYIIATSNQSACRSVGSW